MLLFADVVLNPPHGQGTITLAKLAYRTRMPVRLEDFANASLREHWMSEKGMIVFQLFSDDHIETPVDVFVSMPFDFET